MSNSNDRRHRPGLRAAGRHNQVYSEQELTECDTEPLERIGTIQGNCGYFFSFDTTTTSSTVGGRVLAYSANVDELRQIVAQRNNNNSGVGGGGDHRADASSSSSASPATDDNNNTLLLLSHWFPPQVCDTILELVNDMQTAQSQRTFHFESTLQLALSVSTCAADDYTTIGLEVEIMEALNVRAWACACGRVVRECCSLLAC